MKERTKEAVRYLGYGKHKADEKTLQLIHDAFAELEEAARIRLVHRRFTLCFREENCLQIETMVIKSRNLARNLLDCKEVVLLGATLGPGVDLLMKRYSYTDMAKVVVLQACAAALLEEYLDEWQAQTAEECLLEHLYLRPRFSPGYGDFSIEHQKEILGMLDAAKKIGLTMTEGSMLVPMKSVTAVIGLSSRVESCHKKGCESCKKTDCIYRR